MFVEIVRICVRTGGESVARDSAELHYAELRSAGRIESILI